MIRREPRDDELDDELSGYVVRARAGDQDAWTAIYRALSPAVLGYMRSLGAEEPEDLLGEVFIHVVRGMPTFKGTGAQFRSWVFVVAHHRVIDERRRRKRSPMSDLTIDDVDIAEDVDVAEAALDALSAERVRAVLDDIALPQREVLLLRIVGGLTIEEIAGAVGKTPGAVKALQRRGLAAIKRRLAREEVAP
jgi:RNA polymerase sigma-70 factor (ECF subfamily)